MQREARYVFSAVRRFELNPPVEEIELKSSPVLTKGNQR
jgi:hypothetical protein